MDLTAINRRIFLGSTVGLLSSCSARSNAAGSAIEDGTPAIVGPGPTWNGMAGSGYRGDVPTDPVRTTAKPVAHFVTVSDQVFSSNFDVHVMSRCAGGIASVKFFHEGSSTVVTESGLRQIRRADGTMKTRDCYTVTLDSKLFDRTNGSGVDVYAEITPTDPTMQRRVIGPLRAIPRPSLNDWIKTVSPTGLGDDGKATDFTSLDAAMAALGNQSPAPYAPLIKLMKTARYPIENRSCAGMSIGWCTITAPAGVMATIARELPPDYDNTASWPWHPGWSRIEFRGPGIVLDHKNFSTFHFDAIGNETTPAVWFNGCKNTISCAAVAGSPMNNTYWNKSFHPGWLPTNSRILNIPFICTDDTVEYLSGTCHSLCPINDGTKFKDSFGDPFQNNKFIIHTYGIGSDTRFYSNSLDAMSVTYNGSDTFATIEKSNFDGGFPNAGNGSGSIFIRIGNSSPGQLYTIPLSLTPGGEFFTIQQIVDHINNLGIAGLSATRLDQTDTFAARFFTGEAIPGGNTNGWPATRLSSTPLVIRVKPDVHTEWMHIYNRDPKGNVGLENVLCMNNTSRRAFWGTTSFFNETGILDGWIVNNIWETKQIGSANGGIIYMSHVVFAHNFDDNKRGFYGNGPGDSYGRFSNNIMNQTYLMVGALKDFVTPIRNNISISGGISLSSVGVGNVQISTDQYSSMFIDKVSGNFIPSTRSVIRVNESSPIEKYDQNYVKRGVIDWAGPISKNSGPLAEWPI